MSKRPHKYGAKPTVVDGIRFASMKEARRYGELKLLERAGEIRGLHLQPRYTLYVSPLPPHHRINGPCEEVGSYIADFGYFDRRGDHIVEDVKGFKTPLYRWKKRHVEAQYGITIREV
jgi:hypothetical protein